MNPEFKAKWVEALRHGKSKQISGRLANRTNGRCCLGVACDVAISMGLSLDVLDETHQDVRKYDGARGLLPKRVVDFAGLPDSCPEVAKHLLPDAVKDKIDPQNHLAGLSSFSLTILNDYGVTFKEIADIIERQL